MTILWFEKEINSMNIETLKKRKKELGLTNQQLSQISGVSLGTINKIFSGATKSPQFDTMNALISALGLDIYQYRPDSHMDKFCSSESPATPDSGSRSLHDGVCESRTTYYSDELHDPAIAYKTKKQNGTYTLDDYYALPDDVRAELIDGYLIFMDAPTVHHQDIIGELFFHIRYYIKFKNGPCKVILSPVDVRLDNDDKTILEPDLVIICDPGKSDGRRINGAPDLVVEVVSPSSRKRDYLIKLNKYWAAGVREYWIIDPEQEKISVYLFADAEEAFSMKTYSFHDKVPVGLYEDLVIDFNEFDL